MVQVDLVRPLDVAAQIEIILEIAHVVGALGVGIIVAIVYRLGLVEDVAAGIDIGLGRVPAG
jgi:hypothetical protein